jgi:hypothetical protein
MAHRLAPGAEVELDEIWFWTAKEPSGSLCLAAIRMWAGRATMT